jgi:hypothetical protein
MVTYTAAKLKLAHAIQRTIESLDSKILKLTAKLNKILDHEPSTPHPVKRGRKPKRKMSAAVKAKLSAAAKLRWKKVKAAGKNRL